MTKEELVKWIEAEIEKSKKKVNGYLATDFISYDEECWDCGWSFGYQFALEECSRNIKSMDPKMFNELAKKYTFESDFFKKDFFNIIDEDACIAARLNRHDLEYEEYFMSDADNRQSYFMSIDLEALERMREFVRLYKQKAKGDKNTWFCLKEGE